LTVPNGSDSGLADTIADIQRVLATLPTDADTPYTLELWTQYADLAQCLAAEPVDTACALEAMERIQCLTIEDARSWAFRVAGRLS
jgi:hypothetical protein